jgi:lactate 2-monooxygenase
MPNFSKNQDFSNYQDEIYSNGLRGVPPKLPTDFKQLELKAQSALPEAVLSYVKGGCGDEHTQNANVEAFHHWGLIPRMMVDCSQRDLSVNLLGMKLPSPLLMAPIGVIGLCSQDGHGDIATAKAAALSQGYLPS